MFDILILGATGFTGRLIAKYLHSHPNRDSFTFAIGARSTEKAESLKTELGIDSSVQVLYVDVLRYDTVEAAVQQAKVVMNVAGPYWTRGENVVKACTMHGKRYVDLTGELHFVRKMISRYDFLASKTGAIIVPSCGFVCIPPDFLVFLSNRTLKNALGPQTQLGLSQTFVDVRGGISGGTFATLMMNIEAVPRDVFHLAERDYAISQVKGHPTPPPTLAARMPFSSRYGGFWFEAPTDRGMLQRSYGLFEFAASNPEIAFGAADAKAKAEALRPLAYGPQFRYEEYMLVMSSWAVTAVFSWIVTSALKLVFASSSARWIMKALVPKPGQGPSEKAMQNGWIEMTNYTEAADSPGVYAKSVFHGKKDPGYFLTAAMMSEAALALALDDASLPVTMRIGGVLTPAAAFGDVLIERLEATGLMRFESQIVRKDEDKKTR